MSKVCPHCRCKEPHLERCYEQLLAENSLLIQLLQKAVAHWGDYSPKGGNARKTLDECKAFLHSLPSKTPSTAPPTTAESGKETK
jgi:hypothetical protein